MSDFSRRQLTVIGGGVLLLVISVLAALCGNSGIAETFDFFSGKNPDDILRIIIFELRLPRILAALLCGAALGVAGAILQSVLHNPLASPELLGISAGGGCAGLLVLIWLPSLLPYLGIAVFAGALTVTLLVFAAARSRWFSPLRLILAGVALGALFGTVSTVILMIGSDRYGMVFNFLLGGFTGISFSELKLFAPGVLIALTAAFFIRGRLDMLALGDECAAALGIKVPLVRLTALLIAALGAASAAGMAGMLGFAGLIAPHTVRLLGRSGSNKFVIPASAVAGAGLVLLGDWLGQILLPNGVEIPAGVFLAGCGALFFIVLLMLSRSDDL